MDIGSAISDIGVQVAEVEASEEDEEGRENIVVECRFKLRVKGTEELFFIRGRIVRGSFNSGEEVMHAFKPC